MFVPSHNAEVLLNCNYWLTNAFIKFPGVEGYFDSDFTHLYLTLVFIKLERA